MPLWNVLIAVALIGSIILVVDGRGRIYGAVALVASGLEALMTAELITFGVKGVSLGLILGGALLVAGALCYWRAAAKHAIAAASLVTAVGALQVAQILELL
jgi:hypothetical protein